MSTAGPPPGPPPGPPTGGGPPPWPPPGWSSAGGPAGGWGPPVVSAHRPGVVPLRPLGLTDVAEGVIRTIRGNLQATIGAGLLVTVAALAVLTPLALLVTSTEPDWTGDGPGSVGGEISVSLGEQIPSLASLLTPVVLSAFLAWVVSRAVLGQRVDLAGTWRATRGRLLAVLGSVVLTSLAGLAVAGVLLGVPLAVVLGGLPSQGGLGAAGALLVLVGGLALVAASLFLWTRWAFAAPAIVLERLGPVSGLRRSWRLTGGTPFWRVLGIRLLTTVVVGVAGQILVVPVAGAGAVLVAAAGAGDAALGVTGVVVNAFSVLVAGALTTPFTAGVDAMLYVDQRIRREALDVALIAATTGPGGRDGSGPGLR